MFNLFTLSGLGSTSKNHASGRAPLDTDTSHNMPSLSATDAAAVTVSCGCGEDDIFTVSQATCSSLRRLRWLCILRSLIGLMNGWGLLHHVVRNLEPCYIMHTRI